MKSGFIENYLEVSITRKMVTLSILIVYIVKKRRRESVSNILHNESPKGNKYCIKWSGVIINFARTVSQKRKHHCNRWWSWLLIHTWQRVHSYMVKNADIFRTTILRYTSGSFFFFFTLFRWLDYNYERQWSIDEYKFWQVGQYSKVIRGWWSQGPYIT